MAIAYIGVGSNLGDRKDNIEKAIALLKEDEDIRIEAVSGLHESDFQGEGPEQPRFLNGALKIKTDLLPLDLLSRLKGVERRLGRTKTQGHMHPRTLDLDILFYDDVVIVDGKTLGIPHPRLHERFFVLDPLSEIAPDLVHPRLQMSVRDLRQNLHESSR